MKDRIIALMHFPALPLRELSSPIEGGEHPIFFQETPPPSADPQLWSLSTYHLLVLLMHV